jgi:hypothetical protein
MDCSKVEQLLSEYMESCLPAEETEHIAQHLETCTGCSTLLAEMRSALSLCRSYPSLDMDPDFVEKVLLRTSGRPRTRSFREKLNQYFLHPLLTPQFAVGASLAMLFLVLMANVMVPRLSGAVASLSPSELLRFMDHGVRQMYGEVLKAYEVKNEWQDQFSRFTKNTWNGMRSIMEQMDEPVEGQKKSREGEPQKQQAPKEKSSGLPLWSA